MNEAVKTTERPAPLSVLDLSPISVGMSPAEALANSVDLAKRAEALGFKRYWLAEHHLSPAAATACPPVMMAMVAAATDSIRVGSGAVLLTHAHPLVVLEQFATIAALHPGRIDMGLGRTKPPKELLARPSGATTSATPAAVVERPTNGLVIPARPDMSRLASAPALQEERKLLWQYHAAPPDYREQVLQLLALWRGNHLGADGVPVQANPAVGADLELWIAGSSAGESTAVAGEVGAAFTANYHSTPSTVLESVAAYRAAFRPTELRASPYVMVSADVLVAEDHETAQHLALPSVLSTLHLRMGGGYAAYISPDDAARHSWTADERALIADRAATQFVGDPDTVVSRLKELQGATGADELIITTTAHDHKDRVRSYELLAEAWGTRSMTTIQQNVNKGEPR